MAYISPIELTLKRISEELIEKQEGQVMQAIYQQGITVNKEELIKALAYDRHQYEQGFRDGQKSMKEALKKEITANQYLLSARNNSIDYGMFTTGIMQAIDNAMTGEEEPVKPVTNSEETEHYTINQEENCKIVCDFLRDITGIDIRKEEKRLKLAKGGMTSAENAGDFAPKESAEDQPSVATSRIDDRLLRLEKIISLLIKGGTIHVQEEEGWGITREELEYLRQSYRTIREEHHFTDDYIEDNHQEGSETTRSNDDHQGRDRRGMDRAEGESLTHPGGADHLRRHDTPEPEDQKEQPEDRDKPEDKGPDDTPRPEI